MTVKPARKKLALRKVYPMQIPVWMMRHGALYPEKASAEKTPNYLRKTAYFSVLESIGMNRVPHASNHPQRDSNSCLQDEKLIKIGAKVVTHSRYVVFQMAEVAVPCHLFTGILERIQWFGVPPPLVSCG